MEREGLGDCLSHTHQGCDTDLRMVLCVWVCVGGWVGVRRVVGVEEVCVYLGAHETGRFKLK